MREHPGEQIGLIARLLAHRDVFHLTVRLQFREDPLLSPPTVVELDDRTCGQCLIGHDDLELVVVYVGHEQVELDGLLVLASDALSHEHATIGLVPALGLPRRLEHAHLAVDPCPLLTVLDHRLQLRPPLEGHRGGEGDPGAMQMVDEGLVVERTVHACLDVGPGQCFTDAVDTVFDECARAVGVMHVAGAVVSVEDLTGLGDGGEQWIVAALTFLLLVESDGGAFGMALGTEHRAVEVERDAREALVGEALEHEAAVERAQALDTGGIGGAQSSADGGDGGQVSQALEIPSSYT